MPGSSTIVVRVPSRAPRTGARVFVALTGFLLLALIKPWGGTEPTTGSLAAAVVQVRAGATPAELVTSAPAAPPSPGPAEIVCAPAGWQVVTLDRLADWTVRTWIPAAPVRASGPLDPSIPTVRLESPRVLSIGVCGSNDPAGGDLAVARATLIVAAWNTASAGLRALDVSTAQGARLDSRLARLYAPARGLGTATTWPMGHFILELAPLVGVGAGSGVDGSATRWYIGVTVPAPGPSS
jgi:hypothetical protein